MGIIMVWHGHITYCLSVVDGASISGIQHRILAYLVAVLPHTWKFISSIKASATYASWIHMSGLQV